METVLKDKTVFVSGSSRGIGKCIAEEFLQEGAQVTITGRNDKSVNSAYESLANSYGNANLVKIQGDLTENTSIERAVNTVLEKWGKIDILVANAGGTAKPGWEQGQEEWNRVFAQNFFGSVYLAESVIPQMKKNGGGAIVFISSIAGVEEIGAPVTYTAAKASVASVAKNFAKELAKDNIRVNCVAPGNILFPGGVWEKKLSERGNVVKAMIDREVAMKRFGAPEEVANVVLFLSSQLASFVTGACVVVDGGQTRKVF